MSTDASTKPQSSVTLKDFLASIASIRGDLSNITAPPFVLDTKSVVELPAFWAERPSFFVAPASSSDPAQRALLVLRWFLVSLKNQQYGGRSEQEGVKKPLNAFLGECFLARCQDETGDTMLVSEQVSHHPPVTACRLWNEKHGVSAEGFTRQEITLSLGSITIKQTGHALLTLSKFDKETYLIPLPNVKVKGVLSGLSGTYPELDGTYTIPSTTGYYSTVEFSGKSLLSGGHKNEVVAKLYAPGEAGKDPLYTVTGQWNDSFTIYEGSNDSKDRIVEVLRLADLPTVPRVPLEENLEAQDPWETRRAWHGVREALDNSDMTGAAKAKSVIEQGQRDMREDEKKAGSTWKPLFFKAETTDEIAARLYRTIPEDLDPDKTVAIWKFNHEFWDGGVKRPFHDTLTPDNRNNGEEFSTNSRPVIMQERKQSETDVDLASPLSFKTAHEFPVATNEPSDSDPASDSDGQIQQPSTTIRRNSTPSESSQESTSKGSGKGKRERLKESLGKLKISLSKKGDGPE